MFYYVIYNSTVLNYSNNNKNLNTFIYGTVLYILSHGLINSYDNQFAKYIKSYFWVILAIDIFCIYYLHNNMNTDVENDANSLKSILNSFYNTKNTKEENPQETKEPKQVKENKENKGSSKKNIEENIKENNEENDNLEPIAYSPDDDFNLSSNLPIDLPNNLPNNNISNIEMDQMSDSGSDIDLDNFEISLQN